MPEETLDAVVRIEVDTEQLKAAASQVQRAHEAKKEEKKAQRSAEAERKKTGAVSQRKEERGLQAQKSLFENAKVKQFATITKNAARQASMGRPEAAVATVGRGALGMAGKAGATAVLAYQAAYQAAYGIGPFIGGLAEALGGDEMDVGLSNIMGLAYDAAEVFNAVRRNTVAQLAYVSGAVKAGTSIAMLSGGEYDENNLAFADMMGNARREMSQMDFEMKAAAGRIKAQAAGYFSGKLIEEEAPDVVMDAVKGAISLIGEPWLLRKIREMSAKYPIIPGFGN